MQIIPEHSIAIRPKDLNAVIYLYERDGAFLAKSYKGRAKRPAFHVRFKSADQRSKWLDYEVGVWIREAKLQKRLHDEFLAKREAELAQMKPGSILYASWGWEQTNINFYQVIARKGARSLVLREIKADRDHNARDMSGYCVAIPDAFIGDPIVCQYGRGGAKVSDCQSAWLWDGKPKAYSCYA